MIGNHTHWPLRDISLKIIDKKTRRLQDAIDSVSHMQSIKEERVSWENEGWQDSKEANKRHQGWQCSFDWHGREDASRRRKSLSKEEGRDWVPCPPDSEFIDSIADQEEKKWSREWDSGRKESRDMIQRRCNWWYFVSFMGEILSLLLESVSPLVSPFCFEIIVLLLLLL